MTIKAAFAYPDPDTKEGSVDRVCVQVLIFFYFLIIKRISNVEQELLELFLFVRWSKTTQRAPFRIDFIVEQGRPTLEHLKSILLNHIK